jgi:hypothetical protein
VAAAGPWTPVYSAIKIPGSWCETNSRSFLGNFAQRLAMILGAELRKTIKKEE